MTKLKEVVVGQVWSVRVSGRLAPVRVESIGVTSRGRIGRVIHGTNLDTGRGVGPMSAAKLRMRLHRPGGPGSRWQVMTAADVEAAADHGAEDPPPGVPVTVR
jgi:hypothetical protein